MEPTREDLRRFNIELEMLTLVQGIVPESLHVTSTGATARVDAPWPDVPWGEPV